MGLAGGVLGCTLLRCSAILQAVFRLLREAGGWRGLARRGSPCHAQSGRQRLSLFIRIHPLMVRMHNTSINWELQVKNAAARVQALRESVPGMMCEALSSQLEAARPAPAREPLTSGSLPSISRCPVWYASLKGCIRRL